MYRTRRATLPFLLAIAAGGLLLSSLPTARLRAQEERPDNTPPPGFVALFNGEDLTGWKGLVANPPERAAMSAADLAAAQAKADQRMRDHWHVLGGELVFTGKGDSLCTAQDYGDFELWVDWKIHEKGDSGIYLRGSPQVQIWDAGQHGIGSGALYNNQIHASQPLVNADRPIGEWNTFRIIMLGQRVTVYLNDRLVVNDTPLENYWERDAPIYPTGQIELQNHGNTLYFKNIYLREIEPLADRVSLDAPILEKGDRIAICGDSITEQKLYSRFIETYLTACTPELELWCVQFGWGGERAPGFASRLANDVLPFAPDVATTCYGMNDGLYRPYEDSIGDTYRSAMQDIVERLEAAGTKVVVGSPGAVDSWAFRRNGLPPAVYNDNLAHLRDIARDLALASGQPFANVHDPMVNAQLLAKPVLGDEYHVCGPDGFHPRENGHLIMAFAFLRSMGLDGDLGTITVDMKGRGSATGGHEIADSGPGSVEVESTRYPFCFYGDDSSPSSTRAILPYTRFDEELNRLTLRVARLDAPSATVTWGDASKDFSKEQLEAGINLASEFLDNPFSEAFAAVDAAVAKKQAYETPMVKSYITRFRGLRDLLGDNVEAEAAMETLRRKFFQKDEALAREARAAVVPVTHTITVTPVAPNGDADDAERDS